MSRSPQIRSRTITIDGGVVRRPAYPWTATVHQLLRHLVEQGIPVPEPLGISSAAAPGPGGQIGIETVRFIPGEGGTAAWPLQTTERGVRSMAALLRRVHDAAATWTPPADAVWAFAAQVSETVCHGDPGPWNMVWEDGEAVALIDWDLARPAPRMDDIAYALDYVAPLRSDADCVRWYGFDAPPDRAARVAWFLDAYGISTPRIADAIIERREQTMREVADLAARGMEPQRTWVAEGFLAESERHLDWSRAHLHLLETAPDAGEES